jgi:pimeloyl-ACP methyl ester carboxylesterase
LIPGEQNVLVDFVQTTTRDGLRLDGMFQSPADSAPPASVAFCVVHGTGGNFYNSTLFDALAVCLRQLGCGILRVNTRGHDGISTAVTNQGGRRQGAAYEVVDHCRHDLVAWLDWLRQRTGPRVGLVGHSMGAVKCLYAAAHEAALAPTCVVAISPPRLSYSWFCSSPERAEFLQGYQRAEQHVANGQPGALLEVGLPLPMAITAGGYVEKYGPDERYNYLKFVTAVSCPTLVTLGSVEVERNMAFRGAPEALAELSAKRPHLSVEIIPGADHFYTGVRPELISRVEAWFRASK